MIIPARTKILTLIALVVLSFLAGLMALQSSEERRAELLFENQKDEKLALIHHLIELQGRPLATFVYDYSWWDDMIAFVTQPDSVWARQNIDVGLETYSASAAWVFDTNTTMVYAASTHNAQTLILDTLTLLQVRSNLRGTSFKHFFVAGLFGIAEVRTAPIHPSSDDGRTTRAQGYFVAARLWDASHLACIATPAAAQLSVYPGPMPIYDTSAIAVQPGIISLRLPLQGPDGAPVAYVKAIHNAAMNSELARISDRQILILIGFTLVISTLLLVALSKWVSTPLHQISKALRSADQVGLEKLRRLKGEYGQIGDLIANSLEQKALLQSEVQERRRIANALHESQRALETLMANLPGMAYRCKNDIDWSMDFISEGSIDITGYGPEDLINNTKVSYGELIHPEDRQLVWDGVQSAIKQRIPFRLVYRLIDAQGTLKWILEQGRGVFSDDDQFLAIEGLMLDISDRVAAEEERSSLQKRLDRVQRMESLAILAGGVAHDLNNLLGPVVAYPDLILMRLPDDSPVRDDVETIARSAQQAVDVIQDLLTLARRGRYEMKALNLNDVVQSYLKSPSYHEQMVRHSNVEVACNLSPSIDPILGSSTHLLKAIMNLIVNAFDAMNAGGKLTITTSQQRISKLLGGYDRIETGEYILLSIADTGTGIDQKDISKIFEPYYSRKTMGRSGTGLGLAVVYGIVKDHGGYYDVFSEIGRGTEFVLYLPVTRETTAVDATTILDSRGTETVLVVDDIPEQRKLATDILSTMGYAVEAVCNGHAAIDHLKRNQADIVVLDMILEQDFDGLDTYRGILKFRPKQKAIIVSGFSATDRIQEALQLGAGQFVRKPYTRQSLCKAIREELNKQMRTETQSV